VKLTLNVTPQEAREIFHDHFHKKGYNVTKIEFCVELVLKDRPGEEDRAEFLGVNVEAKT
jgi:hypothetical protein